MVISLNYCEKVFFLQKLILLIILISMFLVFFGLLGCTDADSLAKSVAPTQNNDAQLTLDFLCKKTDTNNLVCGCYLCDETKGNYAEGFAGKTVCDNLSEQKSATQNSNSLLKWTGRCD